MRVLVAVDGSSYSDAAVGFLGALGMRFKAEVTVLAVIPEHVFLGKRTIQHLLRRSSSLKAQMQKVAEERAEGVVAKAVGSLVAQGVKTEAAILMGIPAEEITKACRELRADLLVVGYKGESNTPEFLLGNTAHKVMKYAPCSVLVVKRETAIINKVLVPLDGSRFSDETVRFLLRVQLPHRAEISLMTVTVAESLVVALMGTPTLNVETNRKLLSELLKAEEETAESLMAGATKEFRAHSYRVSATVARGDPAQEILKAAAKRDVDLIALGAKGLSGVRRFLLGGVAQRTARYARCSVLVVRPPKA